MKFISALSALPAVKAATLRKQKSDPVDELFTLSVFTPESAPDNGFFAVTEEQSLQQASFTTSAKNEGNIQFTFLSAEDLVLNYLQDPNGLVTFRNIQASNHSCFALFSNGHSAGTNNETGQYLIPDSGIILSTGNPEDFNGQDSDEATTNFKVLDGDEDLQTVLPINSNGGTAPIYDACYLKFEFRCPEETDVFTPRVNFDYVFASEEYYEYVFSKYNDAFGFFLNEKNIAKLPDSDITVTINNVNHELNSEYFIGNELEGREDNRTSPYMTIEADGLTTELTAIAEPTTGWNEIKLVIGDVSDGILDSWVLLEGGTFGCKERTQSPTNNPTPKPSTKSPTAKPTNKPSTEPTTSPSSKPTEKPTKKPTALPTISPSNSPSGSPSTSPTNKPTRRPTKKPTAAPTTSPSNSPSVSPTSSPSTSPSESPSGSPSVSPTASPSESPTDIPSTFPSESPSWPYPCGLLPCDRRKLLREFYSAISDPATLDNPGTPQSLALDWIMYHDQMMVCPNDNADHITQRYVLAVFYYATEGYKWKSCTAPTDFACEGQINQANNKCDQTATPYFGGTRIGTNETNAWLTPSHECSWGGVACHGENDSELAHTIDQIDFEANNLCGEIPQELSYLKNMRILSLEQGSMAGTLPSFLGLLSQLHIIDLDYNKFSGSIPKEIYGLPYLRQLDLDHNQLTGTLSTEIGLLSELEILQIDNNSFDGTIPNEISKLVNLNVGFFSYNSFSGKISESICALREPDGNLEMLQVDCAREDGEVGCTCCTSCRQPDEDGERELILN